MTGQLIVVFGGTGFLGRVLVRALLEDGLRVRVVARRAGDAAALFAGPGRTQPELVAADIRDTAGIAEALTGADAAVNAVGLYHERAGETFAAVHEEGAAGLAGAAKEAGCGRLVLISGIGADPASPSSYVRSRARGERLVRAAFPEATILRPSALYGPEGGLLTSLAQLTALLPAFPLFGDGSRRLQPVHVADVVQAVQAVLADPECVGRCYELGGADAVSYRALVERVLAAQGRRRFLLPLPFAAWHFLAALAAPLPNPPVTRHQLALMARDNVVAPDALTLADLGIEPRSLAEGLAEIGPGRG